MSIEIHEAPFQDDLPRKWVLAGDGVIGEVTCTKQTVAAMAAGPELLAALHGVLNWAECQCKELANDCPKNEEPPMCDLCFAQCVIDKAEGRTA